MTARVTAPSPNQVARRLFAALPRRYETLAEVLALGQYRRWRHALVDAIAAGHPSTVLDVATGPGGVAVEIEARTAAEVTGVDLTPAMLRHATAVVAGAGRAERIRFVLGRGEQLPFRDAAFDAVSFTYLLRYVADPAATIGELCRVVAPGGVLASIEFGVPSGPVWWPLWVLYTRVGLPVGGWLLGGREWFRVGKFLGPSISDFHRRYPVSWQEEAWRAAGLTGVTARRMSVGGGIVMWGTRAATGA